MSRLARSLGVRHAPPYDRVVLREEGRMRSDASAEWTAYGAQQVIWLERCAFRWHAQSGFAGAVRVQDSLDVSGGRLSVRAFGVVPLGSAPRTPDLTRGELFRYLAELPWAPGAIVANRHLLWTVESPSRFRVAAEVEGAQAQLTLTLDDEGRIAEVYAPDRPRAVDGGFAPTPWRGRFWGYAFREGVWLPHAAAVSWIVEGAEHRVWEGRLTDWRPQL